MMKKLDQDLKLWELADAVNLIPTADSWIQYGEFDDSAGKTEEIEMPLMRDEKGIKYAVNPQLQSRHQLRTVSGRGNDAVVMAEGYKYSGYETRSSLSGRFHLIRPGSQVRVPYKGRWDIGTLVDAQRDADGKVRVQIAGREIKMESAVVWKCDPERPQRMIANLLADAGKREFMWQEERDYRLADEIQEAIDEGPAEAQEACDRVEQALSRI